MRDLTVLYLDASAAMKLVVAEAASQVLAPTLAAVPTWVSSRVIAVEFSCAAQRVDLLAERVAWVIDRCDLLDADEDVLRRAAEPFTPSQRALDAIHLASALSLPDPPAFVSYDTRQLEAARDAGLTCLSPGLPC